MKRTAAGLDGLSRAQLARALDRAAWRIEHCPQGRKGRREDLFVRLMRRYERLLDGRTDGR